MLVNHHSWTSILNISIPEFIEILSQTRPHLIFLVPKKAKEGPKRVPLDLLEYIARRWNAENMTLLAKFENLSPNPDMYNVYDSLWFAYVPAL